VGGLPGDCGAQAAASGTSELTRTPPEQTATVRGQLRANEGRVADLQTPINCTRKRMHTTSSLPPERPPPCLFRCCRQRVSYSYVVPAAAFRWQKAPRAPRRPHICLFSIQERGGVEEGRRDRSARAEYLKSAANDPPDVLNEQHKPLVRDPQFTDRRVLAHHRARVVPRRRAGSKATSRQFRSPRGARSATGRARIVHWMRRRRT